MGTRAGVGCRIRPRAVSMEVVGAIGRVWPVIYLGENIAIARISVAVVLRSLADRGRRLYLAWRCSGWTDSGARSLPHVETISGRLYQTRRLEAELGRHFGVEPQLVQFAGAPALLGGNRPIEAPDSPGREAGTRSGAGQPEWRQWG